MDVYLCEKPSQGRDLGKVLGATQRGKGCLHDGGKCYVTWAFGHLMEEAMPEAYGEQYKRWSMESLPIVPDKWIKNVRHEVKDQVKVIDGLLKKATTVYIASDYDREGERIAREVLEHCQYQGNIKRVCLRALDETSIRKALDSTLDGNETISLYYASLARSRADWLVGLNLTRLFTILGRRLGADEVFSVGRVQTPTIALVCDRDNEIKKFKPEPFYLIDADVAVQNGVFKARWQPPEDMQDGHGRCIDKPFADQVAKQVKGSQGKVTHAETKAGSESAPLPLDLGSLQQYASKRWGYTADETLKGAQKLYDEWKATSYPRTDSRYIPVSQHRDAPAILQALMRNDEDFTSIVAGADADTKGRAFNDKKVSAHHAIIPTQHVTDLGKMPLKESRLYDAVRRFYIAQFYSAFTFEKTDIKFECESHHFLAKGKVPKNEGWKVVFTGMKQAEASSDAPRKDDQDEEQNNLPKVKQGEPGTVREAHLLSKMTRPPSRFTEDTLLGAMENIARFVDEPKYKVALKESAGLGTPATRAETIQGAVSKGYLVRKKRVIQATDKAHALMGILPPAVRSPGMTAQWEQKLEAIADDGEPMAGFNSNIEAFVTKLVDKIRDNSDDLAAPDGPLAKEFRKLQGASYPCFECGSPLLKRKGREGRNFWACQGENCKATFPDERNKPKERKPRIEGAKCGKCGNIMLLREARSKKTQKMNHFWGCSNYPACKETAPYTEPT